MTRPFALIVGIMFLSGAVRAAEEPITVRPERPRIMLRAGKWDGPSVEQIRSRVALPEYKQRAAKLNGTTIGKALLWLVSNDEDAGRKAVAEFVGGRVGGDTPTTWGDSLLESAVLYDWLHDHPDFTAEARKAKVAEFEKWGDKCLTYFKSPETPFYCRYSAVLSGFATMALAIDGDSPKAANYLKVARDVLCNQYGTIRQMEDGATGGGGYGYNWQFRHLAAMAAAWRSASNFDAPKWIKDNQGDWLERQLLFQIWMTYPNGQFFKDGDLWSVDQADMIKYRMQVDQVTSLYRNGFGRTLGDHIFRRWGVRDSQKEVLWFFFVFNEPEIQAKPFSELGRAAVFSPKLHGFVAWRSDWTADATIVHFKCGDTVDHHGTYDEGKFTIFRTAPLAIKNGAYIGYKTPFHMYYKSPWSANVVVFTGPNWDGMQPKIDFDGSRSWAEWKAERDRTIKHPPTGVLLSTEATDQLARAVGDLSGSCPPGTKWVRELVFLDYRYLLVLDRVDAAEDIAHRWTLHTSFEPKLDGAVAVADNGDGRLFCKTLLPAEPKLTLVGGAGHEFDYNGENRLPPPDKSGKPTVLPKPGPNSQLGAWRLDVTPAKPVRQCVYLHVLYPTDVKTDKMPDCSVKQEDGRVTVTVGELSHTFGRDRR